MTESVYDKIFLCDVCNSNLKYVREKSIYYLKCQNCKKSIKEHRGVFDLDNTLNLNSKNKIYNDFWKDIHSSDAESKNYEIEKKIINDKNTLFKNKIILDAGVGDGRHLEIIANKNPKLIICIDLSYGIYLAKIRWDKLKSKTPIIFIKSPIEKINLRSKSIDLIWCTGVLTIADNYLELVKIFQHYAKNSIIIGLLSDNIFGNSYYLLNPFRNLFRLLKKIKILNIMIFPFSLLIFLIQISKNLLIKILLKKNCSLKNTLSLRKINVLLQEPLISPNVNKINKKYLFESMKKNNFKNKFMGKEFFLSYFLFEKI